MQRGDRFEKKRRTKNTDFVYGSARIWYADSKSGVVDMRNESWTVRFLYHTVPGRIVLRIIVGPRVSRIVGNFLDSWISRWFVPMFVRRKKINLLEYEDKQYASFNDFYTRKRSVEWIDITPEHLISPCDGVMSVYPVGENNIYRIKNIEYRLERLLDDRQLAGHFSGGWCLVFRLLSGDYHRYCYISNGVIRKTKKIEGKLHVVHPISAGAAPVFLENSREYSEIESDCLGRMVQMEVGAIFTGKICNHPCSSKIMQGQEKGWFEVGGSAIVILVEKDRIVVDPHILEKSGRQEETKVRMGEMIGHIQKGKGKYRL